ncbi:MAG: bacteriohemerythrin [Bacteroidales bacterium]
MSFIKWHPTLYSINVDEFDQHHKNLVDLINLFHQKMMDGKGQEVLEKVFKELKDYTNYHFSAEERKMLATNYPQYNTHKKEHENLIAQLDSLAEKAEQGERFVSIETFKFLKEWLFDHISRSDKAMGNYLNTMNIK